MSGKRVQFLFLLLVALTTPLHAQKPVRSVLDFKTVLPGRCNALRVTVPGAVPDTLIGPKVKAPVLIFTVENVSKFPKEASAFAYVEALDSVVVKLCNPTKRRVASVALVFLFEVVK